jgi:hypothetical protein
LKGVIENGLVTYYEADFLLGDELSYAYDEFGTELYLMAGIHINNSYVIQDMYLPDFMPEKYKADGSINPDWRYMWPLVLFQAQNILRRIMQSSQVETGCVSEK